MTSTSLINTIPEDLINEHHLAGYLYQNEKGLGLEKAWKSQFLYNTIVRKELTDLGQLLFQKKVTACLLKGHAIMDDIYKDCGRRFASDVDILVKPNDIERVLLLLQFCGYKETYVKKWAGDNFKYLFTKTLNNVEINLEIHSRLFWHTQTPWQKHLTASPISGFHKLTPELQLLHLCGHLGFQHTFLKLFWLVDIFEYTKKHQDTLNWTLFWELSSDHYLYKSGYLCLHLCQKIGSIDIQNILTTAPQKHSFVLTLLKRILTSDFLCQPRHYPFRYFLTKNLIKDSLVHSLAYNFFWLKRS